MGEKFTSRVGTLIRNFRIAADMTQKELAEKCGLNESTIRKPLSRRSHIAEYRKPSGRQLLRIV